MRHGVWATLFLALLVAPAARGEPGGVLVSLPGDGAAADELSRAVFNHLCGQLAAGGVSLVHPAPTGAGLLDKGTQARGSNLREEDRLAAVARSAGATLAVGVEAAVLGNSLAVYIKAVRVADGSSVAAQEYSATTQNVRAGRLPSLSAFVTKVRAAQDQHPDARVPAEALSVRPEAALSSGVSRPTKGWVLAGTSGALLAGAVALLAVGISSHQELKRHYGTDPSTGQPAYDISQSRADALAGRATWSYWGSGTAGLTGLVLGGLAIHLLSSPAPNHP